MTASPPTPSPPPAHQPQPPLSPHVHAAMPSPAFNRAALGFAPTASQTYTVFLLFIITDILLSVDAGALPVALPDISARFKLSRFLQGTVGALSPAGFAVATTSVGVLLTRRSPRNLLVTGLATTAAASICFAAAPGTAFLLLARTMYGTAYAVFFVFAPVWISMYAPEARATSWIGVLQAGAPIGAVLGMVCGGVVANKGVSWRVTFVLQGIGIMLCTGAFAAVPRRFVDGGGEIKLGVGETGSAIDANGKQIGSGEAGRRKSGKGYEEIGGNELGDIGSGEVAPVVPLDDQGADVEAGRGDGNMVRPDGAEKRNGVGQMRSVTRNDGGGGRRATPRVSPRVQLAELWKNKVFVYASLALGFLTFTVEGIRFWVVLYRTEVFGEDLSTVVAAFTIVSSTAPILGMFFGGGCIDKAGGYRTADGVARSLRILMLFSLFAGPSAAAVLIGDIGTTSSLKFFSVSVWFLLFFGAAHVAPLTGIMIAVVPDEARSISSAVSLLVNHVIGYSLAPFAVGIIADLRGIKLGFQTVIMAAALAIFFGFAAWVASEKLAYAERTALLRESSLSADAVGDSGREKLMETVVSN